MNHFSIMLQRRLREQERGEDDDEEGEKGGKKKKKKGGKGGDLRIHDLEDDLEMSSNDSDGSMGEGEYMVCKESHYTDHPKIPNHFLHTTAQLQLQCPKMQVLLKIHIILHM